MKISKKCRFCSEEFETRTADVKRGWGLFCSKSCAAKYKNVTIKRRGDYSTDQLMDLSNGVGKVRHYVDHHYDDY